MVVDDHLLLRVLLDDEPPSLRPGGARLATTGLWYHRLCRAIGSPAVSGALARRLNSVDPSVGAAVAQAIATLPETIDLPSLRRLAWPMAGLLQDGARLNLLSLEALATAEHLGADLCLAVADENPQLIEAARARGTTVRLIEG